MPFERIPTIEIAGFTVKISYLIGVVFILIAATAGIGKLFLRHRLSAIDWSLLILWIFGALSLVRAENLMRSLATIIMWTFVFIIFLLLSRYLKNKKILAQAENWLLVATLIACIFGIYQFVGDSLGLSAAYTGLRLRYTKEILGFPRIQSFALEPLYFANFLFVPLFITIRNHIQSGEKVFGKYFWLATLIFVNIILSVSRGAYFALAITMLSALLIFCFSCGRKYLKRFSHIIIAAVFALAISISLIGIFDGKEQILSFKNHAFIDDSTNAASVVGRQKGYVIAWNQFKASPVFGIGIGNSGILSTPVVEHGETFTYGSLNNEYLEILSETGILGFAAFIGFLVFMLVLIFRSIKSANDDNKTDIALVALGCLAIFIQYNFFSTLYIIYIWAFLALLRAKAEEAMA
jgi:O-antigen ligase